MSSPQSGKRVFETRLLATVTLAPGTFEIELSRPAPFSFTAGQRIRLIHRSIERDYSLVSSPDDPTLRLCIRRIRGGRLTPLLSSAAPGASFTFTGPHGHFVFTPSDRPAVFAATGTGVSPFVSMAGSGVRSFTVLHGVRSEEELIYERELRRAARRYVACISGRTAPRESGTFFRGRVTGFLRRELSRDGAGPYDFYLCGRGDMIREATLTIDEVYPGSRIFTETFF
jgi:benzoate/toluate 1,2-dioxygenase reductase subunit